MSFKPKKKQSKKVVKSTLNDTVTDSVGNYEKHPFFVKKAVEAKALLIEMGLPKKLTKKVSA